MLFFLINLPHVPHNNSENWILEMFVHVLKVKNRNTTFT